jgi:hypothetical protein
MTAAESVRAQTANKPARVPILAGPTIRLFSWNPVSEGKEYIRILHKAREGVEIM